MVQASGGGASIGQNHFSLAGAEVALPDRSVLAVARFKAVVGTMKGEICSYLRFEVDRG